MDILKILTWKKGDQMTILGAPLREEAQSKRSSACSTGVGDRNRRKSSKENSVWDCTKTVWDRNKTVWDCNKTVWNRIKAVLRPHQDGFGP
jgi:hypothetical protein